VLGIEIIITNFTLSKGKHSIQCSNSMWTPSSYQIGYFACSRKEIESEHSHVVSKIFYGTNKISSPAKFFYRSFEVFHADISEKENKFCRKGFTKTTIGRMFLPEDPSLNFLSYGETATQKRNRLKKMYRGKLPKALFKGCGLVYKESEEEYTEDASRKRKLKGSWKKNKRMKKRICWVQLTMTVRMLSWKVAHLESPKGLLGVLLSRPVKVVLQHLVLIP